MVSYSNVTLTFCIKLDVENIVLLPDVLAPANIKPVEQSYFSSQVFMIVLHLLADLEKSFLNYCLRPLDTNSGLIIEVYNTSLTDADYLNNDFETNLFESFIQGLYEDDYGNVIMKGNIALNYTHRQRRNVNSKLEEVLA